MKFAFDTRDDAEVWMRESHERLSNDVFIMQHNSFFHKLFLYAYLRKSGENRGKLTYTINQ